jgi:hypothetical protein
MRRQIVGKLAKGHDRSPGLTYRRRILTKGKHKRLADHVKILGCLHQYRGFRVPTAPVYWFTLPVAL